MDQNLDLWILCAYLVATFIIGSFFIKKKDSQNIKFLSIGEANYNKFILAISIVAVWLSNSSFVTSIAESYSNGIIVGLVFLGSPLSYLFVSRFIVPLMHNFYGMLSVAEIMQRFYGNYGRIITAISAAVFSMGAFILNMLAISSIIEMLFTGLEKEVLVACCCAVVVLYSAFGGIRAITATDIFQVILIAVTVPLIVNIAIHHVGGLEVVWHNIPATHLQVFSHQKNYIMLGLFLTYCIPDMDPSLTQRCLMSKDTREVRSALNTSCIVAAACLVVGVLLGLIATVNYPEVASPKSIMRMFIEDMLPMGLSGLVIIGMLSLCMSTADSRLNTSSVLVVNDIVNPVMELLKMKSLSEKNKVHLLKITSCIIGMIAMSFTIYFQNSSLITVFVFFISLWTPFITIPLLMALFGFKHNTKIFITNIIVSTIFVVLTQALDVFTDGYEMISALAGMGVSLVTIFIAYLICYRSFPRPDPTLKLRKQYPDEEKDYIDEILSEDNDEDAARAKKIANSKILSFFHSLNISSSSQCKLFAMFVVANNFIPYFMWNHSVCEYCTPVLTLRAISTLLCWTILLKNYWNKTTKLYFPVFWYFALFFTLPLVNGYMLLLNANSIHWLINISLSSLLLILLVDWKSYLVITTSGLVCSGILYSITGHDLTKELANGTNMSVFLYTLTFATIIGGIFSRSKDTFQRAILSKKSKVSEVLECKIASRTVHLNEALAIKNSFLHNINHEIRTPIQGLFNVSDILVTDWHKYTDDKRYTYVKEIFMHANRLYSLVDDIMDVSQYAIGSVILNQAKYNIVLVLQDLYFKYISLCRDKNIRLDFDITDSDSIIVYCDPIKISKAIENVINNAIKFTNNEGNIEIKVTKKEDNEVLISITDTGLGVPDYQLRQIFKPFTESDITKSTSGGRGLGLTIAKNIIELHKGKIWMKNNPDIGLTCNIMLPRGADMMIDTSKYANDHDNCNNKGTVLVIDDEPACMMSIKMMLSRSGYTIIEAEDGTKGLELYQKHKAEINCILLDMMLPDMPGLNVLIELQELQLDAPVIIQTGCFDQQEIDKLLKRGASCNINKPYNKEVLLTAVEGEIARHRTKTKTTTMNNESTKKQVA